MLPLSCLTHPEAPPTALAGRSEVEEDAWVREEIVAALGTGGSFAGSLES